MSEQGTTPKGAGTTPGPPRAMDEVSQLLAKIAHDLNNPLAAIIGFADLLQVERSPEKLHRYSRIISSQAERARKLIENLVMHARQKPPQLRPMDVAATIHAATAMREVQLDVEGVRLVKNVASALPPIQGDPQQLAQVLYNLLLNAEQALAGTRGTREIVVEAFAEPDAVIVRVIDTGVGVTAEVAEKAFEPFFTTRSKGGGSGLGLSVSLDIVKRHGGTMKLTPGPGSGAIAEVRIPAHTPEPAAAPSPPPSALNGRTVLVVEDQGFLRDLYAELIGALGGSVLQAATAEQAVAATRSHAIDLIVVSYRLPGDGAQSLHRTLRAEAPELARRLIAVVVEPVDSPTRQWLADHSIPSLAKPFTLDEVQSIARRLLG